MSKFKKVNLLFFIFILVLNCSDSKIKNSSFKLHDTKNLVGTWKIIPSDNSKILFDKSSKSYLIKETKKTEIFALEDVRGLRLQYRIEDDSPFAYFIFTEKTKNIWGGILDEKVVRIVREENFPESILE